MKVGCILLTCGRPELTLQVIKHNFWNSHKDADVYLIDNGSSEADHQLVLNAYNFKTVHRFDKNQGIAAAINKGIQLALKDECEAIVTLANDILMPDGWLAKMVEYAGKIENTGMVGIHCVEGLEPVNELWVHPTYTAFGNVLIPVKAIEKVGYFNTEMDPYGMQDADFAVRLNNTGHLNYYIPGLKAEHIGHDVDNGTEYRAMKDASLAKALDIFNSSKEKYEQTNSYYFPFKEQLPKTERSGGNPGTASADPMPATGKPGSSGNKNHRKAKKGY